MSIAQLENKLNKISTLSEVFTQLVITTPNPILAWLICPRVMWKYWISVRGLCTVYEESERELEQVWSDWLAFLRSGSKPMEYDAVVALCRQNLTAWEAQIPRIEKDCARFEMYFPSHAARIKRSAARISTIICNYYPRTFPSLNDDARRKSEHQYKQGELIDSETFVNGLRGV